MSAAKIRVLVVDDSVFMRTMLKGALGSLPDVEVISTAQNGAEGLDKIRSMKPDVVTLDIEMPGLTGLQVLEAVMKECPTPIVVVSTKTQTGAKTTMEALERGAVTCLAKPLAEKGTTLEAFRESVVHAVRDAAHANRSQLTGHKAAPPPKALAVADIPMDVVIAIGISAGGPQTLHALLPSFPAHFPPIVLTQHMPAGFTGPFAERLNQSCQLEIKEARTNDELKPGRLLLAPGDFHLRVCKQGRKLMVALSDGPKVSGFRPSVDVMFDSVGAAVGGRCVACVLTGMGNDGSTGIRMLKQKGARTIAQDQATSVVYGMPKAAFETGCIDTVAPLGGVLNAIIEAARSFAREPVGV